MRFNRSHFPWLVFTVVATFVLVLLYLAALPQHDPPSDPFKFLGITITLPAFFHEAAHHRNTVGGRPMGLLFGIIAYLIFLFASALGIRKKKRLWPIGRVQAWLRAHIWLTTLTIPLVLFHCGFVTGGPHSTMLFWLYAIVMISGYWGIALQQFMPRLMKESLPREVVFEQIPNIRAKIYEDALTCRTQMFKKASEPPPAAPAPAPAPAAAPAAGAPAAAAAPAAVAAPPVVDPSPQVLVDFLDEEGMPFLNDRRARKTRLADTRVSDDVFRILKLNVSDGYRTKVEDIQLWCDEHRLMARQERLHMILHGWLIIHVPLSFALVVFTFWHAYITWGYQ